MAGYGDDDGFTQWLADNGLSLPVAAPAPAVLRNRGSGYVDGLYALRFPGYPTGGFAQERAWPRTGAYALGQDIDPTLIPNAVIQASYYAAMAEATSPGSLTVTASSGKQVVRKKVDVLEIQYADPVAGVDAVTAATPVLSAVEGLLAPFLFVPQPAVFVV